LVLIDFKASFLRYSTLKCLTPLQLRCLSWDIYRMTL
jgi:hypothetical protein